MAVDLIHGSQEETAKDLVGTGDVCQEADEGGRQGAGGPAYLSATHRARLEPFFNPVEALLAEDVTRRAARDGELGGDVVTDGALQLLLQFLHSRKVRSIVRSNSGSFVREVVHLERLERNCSQFIRTKQIINFSTICLIVKLKIYGADMLDRFKNQIAFTYL